MHKLRFSSFLLFFFCSFLEFIQAKPYSEEILMEDYIYDTSIKTVQLYPDNQSISSILMNPIIPLGSSIPLVLEFDDLGEEMRMFSAQIIHCNADWELSGLTAPEYLNEYNEYNIISYESAMNTKVNYVHYRFEVPEVKVSGNYLLKVYVRNNEEEIILTRRFMVYEEKVNINAATGAVSGVEEFIRNQQINLKINYNGLDLPNPQQQFRIVIRQNGRWDNAILNLKPTSIRDFQKQLDFNYFNLENAFRAGSEFRVIDFRNIQQPFFMVQGIERGVDIDKIFIRPEKSRANQAYSRIMDDINGKFWIEPLPMGNPATEADYVEVNFALESPQEADGDVYVFGGMTDWQMKDDFRMQYNTQAQRYECNVMLKQGIYNYFYTVGSFDKKQKNDFIFENSHNQTGNEYEVFVYYKPWGARGEYLYGYKRL